MGEAEGESTRFGIDQQRAVLIARGLTKRLHTLRSPLSSRYERRHFYLRRSRGGSIGLRIGAGETDLILLAMNQDAVKQLQKMVDTRKIVFSNG